MAVTSINAFAGAMQNAIQASALRNLRDELYWADPSMALQGRYEELTDKLLFRDYPDLSITTPLTPLTEGTPPTARTITMNVTVISSDQYGDLVSISDLAKLLGPSDVPAVAGERVARVAKEVIDRITRDAIFVGGTPIYGSDDHTTRATLDNTDFLTGAHLIRFKSKARKMNIPEGKDGYRLFVSEETLYDLKRDTTAATSFLDVAKYGDQTKIYEGEFGKLHGVRVIGGNRNPTVSSSVTVHQGVMVGGIEGWGVGDLSSLETFYTAPGGQGDELHQKQSVGWKVHFGAGILKNSRFLRVENYASTL